MSEERRRRSEGSDLAGPGSYASLRMTALEVSSQRLLSLDRFKERLEIPLSETLRAFALNDLVKERRPILHRFAEDLEEVSVRIAVHEDAELRQLLDRLVDRADAALELLVIARRHRQEFDATILQIGDGLENVVGRQGQVLHTRPSMALQVFVDLRLLFPFCRLVDRKLDPLIAARHHFGHQ